MVGAGLAGLVGGSCGRAAGVEPYVVLEARDRVGGRVLNEDIGDGNVVDVGGQWIGPTQDRLAALAAQLGAATFPTYAHRARTSSSTAAGCSATPARSRGSTPQVLPDVEQALLRLDRMATHGPARGALGGAEGRRTGTARPRALDAPQHGHRGRAATMLEIAVKAVWAAMPADVSLLHLLFYIHSAGSLDLLLDTEGGAQQDRFVGGAAARCRRLAESARRPAVSWAPRCAASSTAPDGVTVVADGVERAGAARDRRGAAHARRPASPTTRRCRATATSSPSGCRWAR